VGRGWFGPALNIHTPFPPYLTLFYLFPFNSVDITRLFTGTKNNEVTFCPTSNLRLLICAPSNDEHLLVA
jgi:hypothetical protein